MGRIANDKVRNQSGNSKKPLTPNSDVLLHQRAFNNSLQSNLITTVSSGNIITANRAACKLLGYSKAELLSKNRMDIFDINEDSFKRLLFERSTEGQSTAFVTAITKTGRSFPCEITSAVFLNEYGIENAITTITDLSQSILKQQNIDTRKEKLVADNIMIAQSRQADIDTEKERIVARNIVLAKSRQKGIDEQKDKIVAENILLAKSRQLEIDVEKEKIVADNIDIAKSRQLAIDLEKEKIVADNIVIAKSMQKGIDAEKEKIVADNIVLAKSRQMKIDIEKEKVVADNIVIAKSKQKSIDAKKEKIVADNIDIAKSRQKEIDTEKEKIVAENISVAKSKQKRIDAQNDKVVADNIDLAHSRQVKIDVEKDKIVAENIILANSRQKEIDIQKDKLVAENIILAKSRQIKIDTEKERIVADNISLAKTKQKRIDDQKDMIVAENILLAKTKQIGIDAEKERVVIDNIEIALAKSDAQLAENNDWIKYIAETSYDVMWDWNITTGDIYVGDSVEEVFGYKVQNNMVKFSDFSQCILPEQKDKVVRKLLKALDSTDKNWNDSYLFKRQNGSLASTTCRASILRDEEGRAIRLVGAIQDISRLEELEKKLEEQIIIQKELSDIFLVAAKLSFDGIWDWNLLTNDFYLGKGFEELFGYPIKNNTGDIGADWEKYLHPDDKESVEKGLRDAIDSSDSHWEGEFRFVRSDGSIAKVLNRASIMRHADGKAYRMIGAMQDISKQKLLEDRLEQEIRLKEKQILEAMEDAKDAERSDIGKELHDNVNQLLSASRLYLDMAKRGGVDREMFLSRSSEYTMTAIEEIRKLTKGLTTDIIKNLGLCESIEKLTRDLMDVNPLKISFFQGNFNEEAVSDKFKLNVFRIVQEHLNNILKHAQAKAVRINFTQDNNSIVLSIFDNGIGFDTDKKQKGIGLDNIKSRAATFNGTTNFVSRPGEGCVLSVLFPLASVRVEAG